MIHARHSDKKIFVLFFSYVAFNVSLIDIKWQD